MPSRSNASSAGSRQRLGGLLEALEPRVVLSTYTVVDHAAAFGLEDLIRSVAPAQPVQNEQFGYSVAALGDVNADGRADFAVAAPGQLPDPIGRWGGPDTDQGPQGRVFIYSGADLSVIRILDDGAIGFGAAMVGIADLDNDGVRDLVVGSPNVDTTPDAAVDFNGRVTVYSGATGDVITFIDGAGRFFELGYSLANVGDFDGDGFEDVIVGAPGAGADPSVVGPGCAFVYSLVDTTLLLTFTGEVAGDRFGHAVAGGADVPAGEGSVGDGVRDFAVGAPGYDGAGPDSGRAYVFNGQTGAIFLNAVLGDGLPAGQGPLAGDVTPEAGDRFGSSVALIGANAQGQSTDALLRILVGSPGADRTQSAEDPIADRGVIVVYRASGVTGVMLDADGGLVLVGGAAGDRLGERMTPLPDVVLSDGIGDIALHAPGNDRGERLIIGSGNHALFFTTGLRNIGDYASAALLGDADSDGNLDFVFGETDATGPYRVQIVPYTLATDLAITAISDDGSYAVLTSTLGAVDPASSSGYLIRDGRVQSLRAAGLEGLTVRAVNNIGLMYADQTSQPGGSGFLIDRFIVSGGVRTRLADAITSTEGPAPTDGELSFQSMNNGSTMVFLAPNGVYVLEGGFLFQAWEGGGVGHVSDQPVVVGVGARDGPGGPSPDLLPTGNVRVYSATGQVFDIAGLRTTGTGRFIDNLGRIYGHNTAGELLVWQGGEFTVLARFADLGLPGSFYNWTITDVDENGKVAATVYFSGDAGGGPPPSVSPTAHFLFEPGLGLRPTSAVVINPLGIELPPISGGGPQISRLINGNAVVVGGHLGVPQPFNGTVGAAAGSPISVTWTQRGLDVAVSTLDGQAAVLRLTGRQAGLWLGSGLSFAVPGVDPPPAIPEVALYTDPRDGQTYAVARLAAGLVWFTQRSEGVYDDGRELPLPEPIVSHLGVFTSVDQRVHIAGLAASGDMILLFQLNRPEFAPGDLGNWGSVNLSSEHLDPQGQATPRFVSNLTAYVTPWNGLNIAGLDEAGRVHTVWWAPGLTLWQTSDLSAIAGASALRGNVTSYVTGWSGLNVAGTTTDGEIVALWWVPEFGGQWRFDPLLPETPRGLREGTLSAYVTPWSGLNIAGINPDTGTVAVYWWTPTTPWAYDVLPVAGGSPVLDGPLTTIATPPGQIDIFARTGDNAILRFFWNPGDGATWNVDNVGGRVI